ncbi:unnamed protein product [Amoebophrya sp. A25]|nr:unnamed protein product [Amoebophrya sp. A25]|eukprot:GSA25T00022650001.1
MAAFSEQESRVSAWFDSEVVAELRRDFDTADIDGSGTIDVNEACLLFARKTKSASRDYFGVDDQHDDPAKLSRAGTPESSSSSAVSVGVISSPANHGSASANTKTDGVDQESYRLAMRMLQQMNVKDGKITFEQFCFRFGRRLQQERNRQRRLLSVPQGEEAFFREHTQTTSDCAKNKSRSSVQDELLRATCTRGDNGKDDAATASSTSPDEQSVCGFLARPVSSRPGVCDGIVAEVNKVRAEAGLAPLQLHVRLVRSALRHATDVARGRRGFSHAGAEERIGECGFFEGIGENLARLDGYSLSALAESTVRGWMESDGHRRTMLLPDFNVCGIGVGARGTLQQSRVVVDHLEVQNHHHDMGAGRGAADVPCGTYETLFVTMLFAIESERARAANCEGRTRLVDGSVCREPRLETTLVSCVADAVDEILGQDRNLQVRKSLVSTIRSSETTSREGNSAGASHCGTPIDGSFVSPGTEASEGTAAGQRAGRTNGHSTPSRPFGQTDSYPGEEDGATNNAGPEHTTSNFSDRGVAANPWADLWAQGKEAFAAYREPILFLVAWLLSFAFLHVGNHDLRDLPRLIRSVEQNYAWLLQYFPAEILGSASDEDYHHSSSTGGSHRGNPECWNGGFSFEICCNPPGTGNAECWDGVYTYQRCCQS